MQNREDEKFAMFRNRLTKVHRHIAKQARNQGVSCFRVYDHDLPEFPFSIEIYEDCLYVAEYKRRHGMEDDQHERWVIQCKDLMADVLGIAPANIYYKTRQRKAGRQGQYQKTAEEKDEFIGHEDGLQFIINLTDYLDTGLFLDHRITRGMVRKEAAGKKVLNLFAYTGSFSVYAAAGGAAQVTTVDLSNTYTNWAQRNMQLNGFADPEKYLFAAADVLQYLQTIQPESFDIIVMDPPTFSNSKKMDGILDIQRDHVVLINDCLKALRPGGVLYFSTNLRTFQLAAASIASAQIKDITKATTPFDFDKKLFRWCYKISK